MSFLTWIINWDAIVVNARYGRESVMHDLLCDYELIASWTENAWQGQDAYAYSGRYAGIAIVCGRFDHDDESPLDPWNEEFRRSLTKEVDESLYFESLADAIAEIEDLGHWAGPAARLLPQLRDITRFGHV